jgi:predicted 3-demethylubiquinone-9 3-methyltransferase (glyoxalase superfamily)
MQKIVPFLGFEDQAEDAANFYVSIFENSRIESRMYYGKAGPGPEGSVMSVNFQLEGEEFIALNMSPAPAFTPAVSFFVKCQNQEEVDKLWDKLLQDGEEQGPGWIKDQFGVFWQIVPTQLGEYLNDPDSERVQRVMMAMIQMNKLDLEKLKQAYDGE